MIKLFNRDTEKVLTDGPKQVGPFGDHGSNGGEVNQPPFKSVFTSVPIAPGANLDIQIIDTVVDCRQFLIQKRTKQTMFMSERFNAEMTDYLTSQKPVECDRSSHFNRGAPVGVKTARGWVRGEIHSSRSAESYSVYYVDYGRTAVHHRRELVVLPRVFIDRQPAQAICCSLVGVIAPDQDELATHVLKNYLAENHNLSASVIAMVRHEQKPMYILNVFSPNSSLRDVLVDHGCASRHHVHIPPPPFYLSSWIAPEQQKRGVEIQVKICSVSVFHSNKVCLNSSTFADFNV